MNAGGAIENVASVGYRCNRLSFPTSTCRRSARSATRRPDAIHESETSREPPRTLQIKVLGKAQNSAACVRFGFAVGTLSKEGTTKWGGGGMMIRCRNIFVAGVLVPLAAALVGCAGGSSMTEEQERLNEAIEAAGARLMMELPELPGEVEPVRVQNGIPVVQFHAPEDTPGVHVAFVRFTMLRRRDVPRSRRSGCSRRRSAGR